MDQAEGLEEMERQVEKYEADGFERFGDFSMRQGRFYELKLIKEISKERS